MEQLVLDNLECADCGNSPPTSINMQVGVFLCELCSIAHEVLKFQVRSVNSSFTAAELSSIRGNRVVNEELSVFIPPWIAAPSDYDIDFVRLHYAESKYILKSFTRGPNSHK